jgi:dUTP pyrophosphatase
MSFPSLDFIKFDQRARTPTLAHDGDNGFDLYCLDDFQIPAGCRLAVPTGIGIALPDGWAGLITPRSGLATKAGISVVNSPGLVDSNYRGDLGVVLLNTDLASDFSAQAFDRIAQIIFIQTAVPIWREVDVLVDSVRGDGAYGSSGN